MPLTELLTQIAVGALLAIPIAILVGLLVIAAAMRRFARALERSNEIEQSRQSK